MGVSVSPVFLSGAFAGITALIFLLSLIIGQACRERMLWWHAATLGVALVAQLCGALGADQAGGPPIRILTELEIPLTIDGTLPT